MNYTEDSHIETLEQVKEFVHHMVRDEELTLLPEEGRENMTVKELHLFDRLAEEALAVCEKEGVDLYELTVGEMEK